jgi:multisubunit Na+/H+ antiporter MnhB subunit
MVLLLLMYFFLWWLIGAGVAWYGMLIFTISYILLFKGICFEEEKLDESNQTSRLFRMGKSTTILSVCSIWIFLAFAQRSSNYEPINKEKAKHIYYPSVLEYQTGNLSEEKLTNFHFPNLTLMADIINQDDGAYVYRIGSAISYFIQKNDSRVLSDNFMDFFEKLIRRYNTKEEIIDAFKSNGFKYIVFDLNMASYDETPDKTLTKKFVQFMNTLYQNPKVELIATDRQVRLADSNQVIYSIFQNMGTVVNQGTIALYEIK